ncbi:MAG: helix-turn-helix domain-containing protein, partial [Actinomycetota bacterium]
MPVQLLERSYKERALTASSCAAFRTEAPLARARQKNGKDRHQEILEAAARVITDRGLAETRIQDIAERCGVSPGLILYYF